MIAGARDSHGGEKKKVAERIATKIDGVADESGAQIWVSTVVSIKISVRRYRRYRDSDEDAADVSEITHERFESGEFVEMPESQEEENETDSKHHA